MFSLYIDSTPNYGSLILSPGNAQSRTRTEILRPSYAISRVIIHVDQEILPLRMMGLSQIKCCLLLLLLVCLSLFTPLSASDVISGQPVLSPRRLLQVKKPCPVNFEFQNYTIITSQCKGPDYSPKLCCSAFKQFACPFADQLNDLTNDCALTMFSYININGKYPQGLFASLCREQKEGLECPPEPPSSPLSDSSKSSGSRRMICGVVMLSMVMLSAANLVLSLLFV